MRSALVVLRERPFRLLFLGRSASLFGSAFAPIALAFAVIDDLAGSPSQLGLVLAATWVPQVLFILVGGIWADRLPRHLVMVATDLTMAAVQATVAVLLLTDTAQVWHLVALQLVRGTANSFFFPASTGLVPAVVSAERLQEANALLRLTHSGGQVVGAAAAGLVVAGVGAGWALAFDAATFVVSAVLLARMTVPPRAPRDAPSFVRELREGWTEFASRTWLWAIVVQFLFVNGFAHSAWFVLGPVISKEDLGGASAWGLIVSAEAAGMIVGGLIALRTRPSRMLLVATLAIFLFAPAPFLLAETAPLLLIAAAGVVMGIGAETFGVLWDTTLQQQIPGDRLSRVSSWDALGSFVAIPIGLSVVGPLSDAVGREETLLAAACLTVAATALVLLIPDVRRLRRLDGPPVVEPEPPVPTPLDEGFARPTTEPAP